MPTAARTRREKRKRKAGAWAGLGCVVMAIGAFVLPKYPGILIVCAVVAFAASIPVAQTGYIDRAPKEAWLPILSAHAVAIALLFWLIWPAITVSPRRVSFAGYPNETFNFSVRNGRVDDVYDVQVPFLIGYNKHLDGKISAKVGPTGDPAQRIYDDYNYCYGKGKDVHKILPNEQEVLVVRIGHLPPSGSANFAVTYAGGDKFVTKAGRPNFLSEPYSYSPMQGTIGVRGDYRICKYVLSTDGLAGK
jgi:hypothetical protein